MLRLIATFALLVLLAVPAIAAQQEKCPVMGGSVDHSVYTDYKGQRIYFCCPSCVDEFKKNPEKYLKKMQDAGVEPEAAPAAPAGEKK